MNELNEIVGDDVNIAQEAPETEETQAEPAQTEPAHEETAPEPEQPRVVPLAALHEERARRKELVAQLQAAEQRQRDLEARVESRLNALAKANEPPPPSFEENPALALKHQLDGVSQTLAQQQEAQRQEQSQRAQMAQVQQAAQAVTRAEAEFAQQKPDYLQAVEYVRNLRQQEFEVMGMDPDAAKTQATREMIEGALENARRGVNAPQLVYKMAELRGYKPQAQQPGAAEKFDAQARGAAAARSLGGGGAARGQLNAQQLLAMSDDEFSEATKGGKWNKLMGG